MTERKEPAEQYRTPSRAASGHARRSIIGAARPLFAAKGYSGGTVDEITVRAKTTKPMLCYYVGNKEALFAAVLEDINVGMRKIESALRLTDLPAVDAMRKVVQVTFVLSCQ